MYFLRLRKMIYYFTEGSESLTKELLDSGVDEGYIIQYSNAGTLLSDV